MDKVFIRSLAIEATIGLYAWERRVKQSLVLDIQMGHDIRRAAQSDDIAATLDYKTVSKRIQQFVADSKFELVESVAERCADIIMGEFGVPWVHIVLNKSGAVRGAQDVGVIIERRQPRRVLVSVGANLQPEENIRAALQAMRQRFGHLLISPVYKNQAVGFDGPDFYNLVVEFNAQDNPYQIASALRHIEKQQGREACEQGFSSRTIDLDLILYGQEQLDADGLTLPRHDLTEYAHVLKPAVDIAPELIHPNNGLPLNLLWAQMEPVAPSMDVIDLGL